MRKLATVWCVIAVALVFVSPAAANIIPYTFDGLTDGGANLNGQDNWTSNGLKVWTNNSSGGGAPHYGSGNLVSYTAGGTALYTATRPNNANWSFSLAGIDQFAIQCDLMFDYQMSNYYGQGLFGLRYGTTPIFTGGLYVDATHRQNSGGTWLYWLRGQTGSGGTATTTYGNVNDPGGWNNVVVPPSGVKQNWQYRFVFDLAANGGEGSYSMYARKIVDSDPSHWAGGPGAPPWVPVPGLQNINALFATKGLNMHNANTLYLEQRVRMASFDNFMILTGSDAAVVPEPATLLLVALAGAAGLLVCWRRARR